MVPLIETRWFKGVMFRRKNYELFLVVFFQVVMSTRALKMWSSKAQEEISSSPRVCCYRCCSGENGSWEIPTVVAGNDGVELVIERE